jgi:hypothetical protein
MKSILSCLVFFVLSTFILTSCKKGDTGPQGPTGNANVMYSEWFKPDVYIKDTVFSTWGFKYNKAAPGITQKIVDSGTVLVYGKMLGYNTLIWPANSVGQLPINLSYQSGGLQLDTWSALISEGNVRIRFTNDHNIYASVSNAHLFRYIIIPANTKVNGRAAQPSYEEICRQYNIPE